MIGALDRQTRLARVVVTVDDPLGRKSDVPPLIIDTLIEASIEGVAIEKHRPFGKKICSRWRLGVGHER